MNRLSLFVVMEKVASSTKLASINELFGVALWIFVEREKFISGYMLVQNYKFSIMLLLCYIKMYINYKT